MMYAKVEENVRPSLVSVCGVIYIVHSSKICPIPNFTNKGKFESAKGVLVMLWSRSVVICKQN